MTLGLTLDETTRGGEVLEVRSEDGGPPCPQWRGGGARANIQLARHIAVRR